jgi:hypothetical protein
MRKTGDASDFESLDDVDREQMMVRKRRAITDSGFDVTP